MMQHDHPGDKAASPVHATGKADVIISGVAHSYNASDGAVLYGIDLI
jgi:hypothetical protein